MEMINKIKEIEKYVCSNFEELDLDDPIEEGYFEEYENISGACQNEITLFEGKFDIVLPADFKELYKFAAYLSLNTIMNMISKSRKEKYVMTPLSLIAGICFWITAFQM